MTDGHLHVVTAKIPSGSYATYGDVPGYNPAGPYTTEYWAKLDEAAEGEAGLVHAVSGRGEVVRLVRVGPDRVACHAPGLEAPILSDPLDASDWHLYTQTFDGTRLLFYVDGTLQGQATLRAPPAAPAPGDAGPNRIVVTGLLREMRIWTVARSQDEIILTSLACPAPLPSLGALFDFGQIPPVDTSGNSVPVALGEGCFYHEDTYAIYLSDDAYVDCGSPAALAFPAAAPFTVEAWIIPTSTGAPMAILTRRDGAGNGYALSLDATGRLVGQRGAATVTSSQPLAANDWHHVAMTFDGTTLQLYVDGLPDANAPSPGQEPAASAVPFTLGADASGATSAAFFQGYLEEVRVWSVCQPAAAIQALMDRHPVFDPNIRAYYAFDFASPGDASGQQPPIALQGGAVLKPYTSDTPVDAARPLRPAARPPVAHPTVVEPAEPDLQAAFDSLWAAHGARWSAPRKAPRLQGTLHDHERALMAALAAHPRAAPGRGPLVRVESQDGRLVLLEDAPGGPRVLLRATGVDQNTLVWYVAIVVQVFQTVFALFGLTMVSGSKAANVGMRLLANPSVLGALQRLMAEAVTLQGILTFTGVLYQENVLASAARELLDLGIFATLRLVMRLVGLATGASTAILVAEVAIGIAALVDLIANPPTQDESSETLKITMLQAKWGDSLVLEYEWSTNDDDVQSVAMLVDGGPSGCYAANAAFIPQRLDVVCTTHVDDDHINGIITLFQGLAVQQPPPPVGRTVGQLLFNVPGVALEDLQRHPLAPLAFGPEDPEALARLTPEERHAVGILRSSAQGLLLAQLAQQKAVPIVPIRNTTPAGAFGLTQVSYIGPTQDNINKYNANLQATGMLPNRASIMFQLSSARYPAVTVLMTADGFDLQQPDTPPPPNSLMTDIRGNPPQTNRHFLFLKVPHHGSIHSEDHYFYAAYTADYYLVSASDARHNLPALQTLQNIVQGNRAKGLTGYKIYCTNLTTSIQQLQNDPVNGPGPAGYRLFVLADGVRGMTFEVTDGQVVPPMTGVTVVELTSPASTPRAPPALRPARTLTPAVPQEAT